MPSKALTIKTARSIASRVLGVHEGTHSTDKSSNSEWIRRNLNLTNKSMINKQAELLPNKQQFQFLRELNLSKINDGYGKEEKN